MRLDVPVTEAATPEVLEGLGHGVPVFACASGGNKESEAIGSGIL